MIRGADPLYSRVQPGHLVTALREDKVERGPETVDIFQRKGARILGEHSSVQLPEATRFI